MVIFEVVLNFLKERVRKIVIFGKIGTVFKVNKMNLWWGSSVFGFFV